jgi:CelD/BcsL family acetyltransferase involved in cellulose biosynthesis/SAM-dependent methyltransferase
MLRSPTHEWEAVRNSIGTRLEHRTRVMTPCRRLRFDLVLRALEAGDAGRPRRILDAGAGEGILAIELARRHRNWQVVAADLNQAMLNRGRRQCELSELPNVTFVHSDLTADLGSDEFDVVMAIECLVEIPDDEAALHAMTRALRPGGRLIAHVPRRDWAPVLPGSASVWRHEVRHGYGAEELRAKMERVGLMVDAITPTARSAVFLAQEMNDRVKDSPLRLRTLSLPFILAAERLERQGMTWGPSRALLVDAHRRRSNRRRARTGLPPRTCEVTHLASLGETEKTRWTEIRLAAPGLDSPFFTYEFCALVAAVRADVRVAVLGDSGLISGFFPFQRDKAGRGRPLGGKLSDYHGVIADPDLAWDARELLRALQLRSYSFDHLALPSGVFAPHAERLDVSPFLDLSPGFPAYRQAARAAGLGGPREAEMKLRRLERRIGEVRFVWHETDQRALQTLLRWKSLQYRRTTGFDPLSLPWVVEVIERVHAAQTSAFAGVLSCLYVENRLIATHLGLRAGPTLHSWIPAYDRDLAVYSPGLVLLLALAERAAADGVLRLDLGKGPETYKRRFTAEGIPVAIGSVQDGLLAPAWSRVSGAAWSAVLSSPLYGRAHPLRRRLQFR